MVVEFICDSGWQVSQIWLILFILFLSFTNEALHSPGYFLLTDISGIDSKFTQCIRAAAEPATSNDVTRNSRERRKCFTCSSLSMHIPGPFLIAELSARLGVGVRFAIKNRLLSRRVFNIRRRSHPLALAVHPPTGAGL